MSSNGISHVDGSLGLPQVDPSVVASALADITTSATVALAVGPLQGAAILDIAKRHIGQRYANINIDYTDPNWRGAFDCAEYTSYCVWRAYGMLYGARLLSGTKPQGKNVEAYTGYWQEDANNKGMIVSADEALRTPGAFVLRYPPAPGRMGHIGICLGDGDAIYEAHSTNLGVIKGSARDRRWNVGVLLPGIDYGRGAIASNRLLIYRELVPPGPKDDVVALIQQALATLGLLASKDVTGVFDSVTGQAVTTFQRQKGWVVDGEVGPETGTGLGLGRFWGRPDVALEAASTQPSPSGAASGDGIVSGQFNSKYNVTFGTHIQGGYFSADPDDLSVRRALRTNNPGALNISKWQTEFRGFVGRTQPDGKGNVTTIYRTPEHGAAAWYHLVAERYGIVRNGRLTIGDLAASYSGTGSASTPAAKQYIKAWSMFAGGAYDASTVVTMADDQSLLALAYAMFANETGFKSPLLSAQILYGVNAWRTKTLT